MAPLLSLSRWLANWLMHGLLYNMLNVSVQHILLWVNKLVWSLCAPALAKYADGEDDPIPVSPK